jgi:GNAT superfamily N-acetyltransferase
MTILTTPATLTTRPAQPADEAFLQRLYASTRDDLRVLVALDPASVDSLIAMQAQAQAAGYRGVYPQAQYLVVERDGAPVGRLVVDEGPQATRLVDISLLPEVQGQGLGTTLLRRLQAAAALRNVPLALSVLRTNPRARQLYLACGFAVVAEDAVRTEMVWQS